MKFIKDNITWIAPTVAIVAVASGVFDEDSDFALFGSKKQTEQQEATVEENRNMSELDIIVQAALGTPVSSQAPAETAIAGVAPVPTPDLDAVSRNVTADLLQVAPVARPQQKPEVQPVSQTAPFDAGTAADFFASAQADLAVADSCKEDLEELAAGARVYFPAGAISGEDAGLSAARLIGMVVRDCPGFTIQVEGHSDPSGDPRVNLRLSEERARAVISRLAASGIDTGDFVAVGYGDTRPSTVRGPEKSAYYDRRVEFSVVPTAQRISISTTQQPWRESSSNCVSALQAQADQVRQYYADRAITVPNSGLDGVFALAQEVAQCDGAWLRIVGQHSDDLGSRENVTTGRLRALAMMSTLVAAGFDSERILVGAPSYSVGIPGQPALPNSRVDFQVISN